MCCRKGGRQLRKSAGVNEALSLAALAESDIFGEQDCRPIVQRLGRIAMQHVHVQWGTVACRASFTDLHHLLIAVKSEVCHFHIQFHIEFHRACVLAVERRIRFTPNKSSKRQQLQIDHRLLLAA